MDTGPLCKTAGFEKAGLWGASLESCRLFRCKLLPIFGQESPVWRGLMGVFLKVLNKLAACNFCGPQRCKVLRVLLAVDHGDKMRATKGNQRCKCNFRCIRSVAKHRLAKNHATEINAIQATHQTTVNPGFNAVGMSVAVKLAVSLDHLFHNPSSRLTISTLACARPDYMIEVVVDSDLAVRIGYKTRQCFAQ